MSDDKPNHTAAKVDQAADSAEQNLDTDVDIDEAAETLRAQAGRSEKQLHELESVMEEMLRDHDTIQEDRDQTRTLIESVRADLNRANSALARIEAGTFGRCTTCGGPIAPARLQAIPEAERCTNCA